MSVAFNAFLMIGGRTKIRRDNLVVVGDFAVSGGTLGPRNTRVGNEDVKTTIELLDNLVDSSLDAGLVGHVDLVSLGCGWG